MRAPWPWLSCVLASMARGRYGSTREEAEGARPFYAWRFTQFYNRTENLQRGGTRSPASLTVRLLPKKGEARERDWFSLRFC